MASLKEAVRSGQAQRLVSWLQDLPDVNGLDPIDYVAERPVHQTLQHALLCLGCSKDPQDRAAYKLMVDALFSFPGLDLNVRALPHGYLHQNIVVTNLPNELLQDVLSLLAEKRGMTVKDLLNECAPLGGKPTPSALYIVAEQACMSRDLRKVGLLLELGAAVDDRVRQLLTGSVDPHDVAMRITMRGAKPTVKRMLGLMEAREADPGGWRFVDDAPEEGPERKRRRTGPRQFYK